MGTTVRTMIVRIKVSIIIDPTDLVGIVVSTRLARTSIIILFDTKTCIVKYSYMVCWNHFFKIRVHKYC